MTPASESIAVLGDAREERGLARRPLWLVQVLANAFADAFADAYADAAADADADADADAADADAAADAAAADKRRLFFHLLTDKDYDMRNGLKIIQLTGAYYGYAVTKIAWIRRVAGDEWEIMPGARTVIRTGSPRTLDSLASQGPRSDHRTSDPSIGTEEIHRLVIRRALPADPGAWSKLCPMPAHWIEAE